MSQGRLPNLPWAIGHLQLQILALVLLIHYDEYRVIVRLNNMVLEL